MKDNFSSQAKAYSRFRPSYPPDLIAHLVSLAPDRQHAWDCATGNGQVAIALAEYFDEIFATDISQNQLGHARQHPKIQYSLEMAEKCSAPDGKFDLITVAQAIHWFDFDRFFTEARRVLQPGGVLALIGYSLFDSDSAAVDSVIRHFYLNITGPYWDAERSYIDAGYRTIPFPFEEIEVPEFRMEYKWTVDDVLGYLSSWSAVQHYIRKNGQNPLDLIDSDLKRAWGDVGEREISCQILLKVGRKI